MLEWRPRPIVLIVLVLAAFALVSGYAILNESNWEW